MLAYGTGIIPGEPAALRAHGPARDPAQPLAARHRRRGRGRPLRHRPQAEQHPAIGPHRVRLRHVAARLVAGGARQQPDRAAVRLCDPARDRAGVAARGSDHRHRAAAAEGVRARRSCCLPAAGAAGQRSRRRGRRRSGKLGRRDHRASRPADDQRCRRPVRLARAGVVAGAGFGCDGHGDRGRGLDHRQRGGRHSSNWRSSTGSSRSRRRIGGSRSCRR